MAKVVWILLLLACNDLMAESMAAKAEQILQPPDDDFLFAAGGALLDCWGAGAAVDDGAGVATADWVGGCTVGGCT